MSITVTNPEDPFGPPAYEGPVTEAHLKLEPGIYQTGDPASALAVNPLASFLIAVFDVDHIPADTEADCEAPEDRDQIDTPRELRVLATVEAAERLASRALAILADDTVHSGDAIEHARQLLLGLITTTSIRSVAEVKGDQRVLDSISRQATGKVAKVIERLDERHRGIAGAYSRTDHRYHW
jgi:hypothetical protein